jgi:anti-sigma regulatory factor (Ser/Thr protein kinase)
MTTPMERAQVSAHFPGDAASAGPARRFLAATLDAWHCPDLEEIAVLLVSELAANVALHAAGEMEVVVVLQEGRLRVEVHDCSPALPQRKHYSRTATTGRGLGLVEQLADTWGVDLTESGKGVWFELVRGQARPGAAVQPVDIDTWADLDIGDAGTAARPASPRSARGGTGPGRGGRASTTRPISTTR